MKDQNETKLGTGTLEEQRQEFLDRINHHLSDDLKQSIDIAFKLSKKEIPAPNLTFTNGRA